MAEGGFLDACDVDFGDGSFGCLVDAGIDAEEGLAVSCEACCYCLVVDGAKVAHIERGGVAAHVLAAHPCLVGEGEHGGDGVEGHVLVASEAHEASEGLDIVGCGAASSCISEQAYLLAEEVEHGGLVAGLLFVGVHDVVCRKVFGAFLQTVYDFMQLLLLPLYLFFDTHQCALALFADVCRDGHLFCLFIPLCGEDEAFCIDLSDLAAVYDLEIKVAFFILDRGRSQF